MEEDIKSSIMRLYKSITYRYWYAEQDKDIENLINEYGKLEDRYLKNRQRTIKLETKIKEKIEEFKKLSYEISGYDFKCVPKDLKRNDYAVKMLEELLEVKNG